MIDSILSILLMNFSCCLLLVSILYLLSFLPLSFSTGLSYRQAQVNTHTHPYTVLSDFILYVCLSFSSLFISFHFIFFLQYNLPSYYNSAFFFSCNATSLNILPHHVTHLFTLSLHSSFIILLNVYFSALPSLPVRAELYLRHPMDDRGVLLLHYTIAR